MTENRFGKLLRKYRKELDLNQWELYQELWDHGYVGVRGGSVISRWETGRLRPPRPEIIQVLERRLGSPEGLLLEAAGYGKAPRGLDIATQLKGQLFTPAPEDILIIDDLGSLGDHSTRLRQDTLNVVLQSLGYTAGVKATVSTTTWGALRPREIEVFWTVLPSLLVERYCPVERDPLFQHWLASTPRTLKQHIAKWKQLEGSYLAGCSGTWMKIHERARRKTRAWLAEGLIASLPRMLPSPPQPLTVNFSNLIYQLAIEYCRSEGARGLPDESSYHTMPGDHPPFVKLVLGPTQIPLGNPLPGLVKTWIDLHRRMIVEWGQSIEIGRLLDLFQRLQDIEKTIKTGI